MARWVPVTYINELKSLADLHGVATSYHTAAGELVEVSEDTLTKTLSALGVDILRGGGEPTAESLAAARQAHLDSRFTRPLPPCVVTVAGQPHEFTVHVHDGEPVTVTITLEDGGTVTPQQVDNFVEARTIDGVTWGEASFAVPTDLPLGWHTLSMESTGGVSGSCRLVVTPARLSTSDRYLRTPVAGVMAQLYSTRSRDSWGIGDFGDLRDLGRTLAENAGADFLLINPLHAAEPFPPVEDSPYLPTTRRFTNPLYIRVEDIEEYGLLSPTDRVRVEDTAAKLKTCNTSPDEINRNPIYAAKLSALREIYELPMTPSRAEAFTTYLEKEGRGLDDFATWCARRELEVLAAGGTVPGVDAARERTVEEAAGFYRWLQWICDDQLRSAQKAATDAGMSIGVMADLAVGVHPGGADAENLSDVLVQAASVGAPPDDYNQQGQDWSQPPWHPERLAECGYAPWRDMLRTVLRHSGGIRVDHVLGLFRLWWIPRMQPPTTGTYVHYDYAALVGILALEAERAGAVVIGEDLGTFEPWVQEVLSGRGIMGTSILWFEHDPEISGPRRQDRYRELALTSVTTHDLPPTAGMLRGEHIQLRERLGLFTTDPEEEDRGDLAWQNEVLARIREHGCFAGTTVEGRSFEGAARGDRGPIRELLVGMHRYIAGTPSALACTSLVDMVGDVRAQNQPGTTHELYPNWCVPLCDGSGDVVLIEDLPDNPWFRAVAEASKR